MAACRSFGDYAMMPARRSLLRMLGRADEAETVAARPLDLQPEFRCSVQFVGGNYESKLAVLRWARRGSRKYEVLRSLGMRGSPAPVSRIRSG